MGLNIPKRNNIKPKKGNRVRLIKMDDQYTNLKPGDEGVVKYIDDLGTIHVNWDNGSGLGLIPDVDKYEILSENDDNQYRPFPKQRDAKIGRRNAEFYRQGEEEMVSEDDNNNYSEEEEEVDPFEGKERRFRVSVYCDVHVPMTEDLEYDRQVAEQEASEILKKLNQKSISNSYIGGVAVNPFGSIPDPKEFARL